MGKLSWQHVALIGLVIAAMFGANLMGKDFDTLGLLAVLGALGFVVAQQQSTAAKTEQIKEQTNGNVTRLINNLEQLTAVLAVAPSIPPEILRDVMTQHAINSRALAPAGGMGAPSSVLLPPFESTPIVSHDPAHEAVTEEIAPMGVR